MNEKLVKYQLIALRRSRVTHERGSHQHMKIIGYTLQSAIQLLEFHSEDKIVALRLLERMPRATISNRVCS